ncbi:unnamed protein product [Closterium sp. NIES-54]
MTGVIVGVSGEMAEESWGTAGKSSRTAQGSGGTTEVNNSSYTLIRFNHTRAGKRKRPLVGDVLLELGESAPTGFKRLLGVAGVLPEIHRRLRRSNATVLAPSDSALAALLPLIFPLVLQRLENSALFPRNHHTNSVFPRKLRAMQQGARRGESSDAQLGIPNEQLGGLRQAAAKQLGSAERQEVLREIALCHVIPARVSLLQWHGEHRSMQGTRLSLASSGLRFTVSNVHVSSVDSGSVPVLNGTLSCGDVSNVAVTVGATVVTRRLVVYTVEGILLPMLLGGSVSVDHGRRRKGNAGRGERGSWREGGKGKEDGDQGCNDAAADEIKSIEQTLQAFLDRRTDVVT